MSRQGHCRFIFIGLDHVVDFFSSFLAELDIRIRMLLVFITGVPFVAGIALLLFAAGFFAIVPTHALVISLPIIGRYHTCRARPFCADSQQSDVAEVVTPLRSPAVLGIWATTHGIRT